MEQQPHILVVDDDKGLCELLQLYLTDNLLTISLAHNGRQLDERLAEFTPDLVVLDLMMPGEDGLSMARRLRQQSDLPILMISARGDEIDRIIGLEMGADDYLPKPFSPRELLARIKALLRRSQFQNQRTAPAPPPQPAPLPSTAPPVEVNRWQFGSYRLKPETAQLFCDGREIAITQAESALLRVFVENPNQTMDRDALVAKLRGFSRQPFDRSIDVRVTRLRKKLEPDPANPIYIRTIWGRGYLFTPQGELS